MKTLSILAAAALAGAAPSPEPLDVEITALDARVFDAYNRRDLDTFGSYFDPHVIFFHDTGGATFDRATVIANTRRYICGKVRRELVPATLRIYPIKGLWRDRGGRAPLLRTGRRRMRRRCQVRHRLGPQGAVVAHHRSPELRPPCADAG